MLQVQDALTGDFFDLSVLASRTLTTTSDGVNYALSVCGDADGCGAGVGACEVGGQGRPLGNMNKELTFDDSQLSLNLPGGFDCGAGAKFETVIIFECDPKVSPDQAQPRLLERTACSATFVVDINTRCHSFEEVECVATNADRSVTYDLSALANAKENWVAKDSREDNKYAYEINVCRTLVPNANFKDCGRSSASCQVSYADGSFLERVGKREGWTKGCLGCSFFFLTASCSLSSLSLLVPLPPYRTSVTLRALSSRTTAS